MPTGYTCIINDGNPTAAEYISRCARAFGFLIHMRDMPMDAPLAPWSAAKDSYHAKTKAEKDTELARLYGLSDEGWRVECEGSHAKAMAAWRENEADRIATVAKYDAMAVAVSAWTPPAELSEIKSFALSQLATGGPDREPWTMPALEDVAAFREETLRSLEKELEYHQNELAKQGSRDDRFAKLFEEFQASLKAL